MVSSRPAPSRAVRASRWSVGRVVAVVVGLVLLLPGIGLLVGGGALLWADGSRRTADGWLMTDARPVNSPGFALTSTRLNLSTGADWLPVSSALGIARVDVTATGPGREIFVGVAQAGDADAYLSGVRRTVVDDVGAELGTRAPTFVGGGAPPGPPAAQDFWVVQTSGGGTQQLTWQPTRGNWVLVVMNADGSAGVSVIAAAGASVPSLGGLAWGLLIAGALTSAVAVLLIGLAVRGSGAEPFPSTRQAAP